MNELTRLYHLGKATMTPENDPASSAVKPAWKTTEFWLSIIAMVVGYLLTSGVLDSNDPNEAKLYKALVAISGILGALGYTFARTSAKNKAVEGATAVAMAKEVGLTAAANLIPTNADLLKGMGVRVPTQPSEPK